MILAEYRTQLGLTLQQTAVALGLRPTSASWLSEIENGKRDASLRLALRIERWSDGQVSAASVCSELRDEPGSHDDAPTAVNDLASMPGSPGEGAEKNQRNFSRTGEAA